MKYIVTRSSEWGGKPLDEAIPCKVYPYTTISGNAADSFKNRMREKIDVTMEGEDGSFGGYMKKPVDAWICDIPNLYDFVKKHGRIILSQPDTREGYWNIEIYDSYRE